MVWVLRYAGHAPKSNRYTLFEETEMVRFVYKVFWTEKVIIVFHSFSVLFNFRFFVQVFMRVIVSYMLQNLGF